MINNSLKNYIKGDIFVASLFGDFVIALLRYFVIMGLCYFTPIMSFIFSGSFTFFSLLL